MTQHIYVKKRKKKSRAKVKFVFCCQLQLLLSAKQLFSARLPTLSSPCGQTPELGFVGGHTDQAPGGSTAFFGESADPPRQTAPPTAVGVRGAESAVTSPSTGAARSDCKTTCQWGGDGDGRGPRLPPGRSPLVSPLRRSAAEGHQRSLKVSPPQPAASAPGKSINRPRLLLDF